jgi:signal transduction histidine kinase
VASCRTQALWTAWNDLRVSSTARLSDPGAEHAGDDRWWRFAVLAAVLYLAAFTAIPPDSVEIRTVMNAAADLAAVLMILYGVRHYEPQRPKAWWLLAGGLAAWLVADSIFGAYQSAGKDPYPSIADAFYLLGYALLVAGLLRAVRVRSPVFDVRALFDPAIVTVGAAFFLWVYVAAPAVRDHEAGTFETVVSVAYPLADVLLIAIATRLTVGVKRAEVALLVLLGGLALVLAGDVWYALAPDESLAQHRIADTLLVAGALGIALAGLHRSMTALIEPQRYSLSSEEEHLTLRLIALAVVFLIVPTVLIIEDQRGEPLPLVAGLITTMLLSSLVVGRYAYFFVVSRRSAARERSLRKELDEQNEQLREMDRMKDQFVSSVSHELRTPLTSIVGYIELLLDEEEFDNLDDEQRQFLGIVDRNCHRLTRLVDDILFIARVDAGRLSLELQSVDLAELASMAVESARPFAGRKNQTLKLEAEPDLPALQADPTRMNQLIDNLISNAIKYTPEGGTATVVVARSDGAIHVEVRDTGVGIPPDELEKLFVRFFRASTSGVAQGTGLGLSIVKSIVEAHRGTIDVRSEVGEGTTFLVDLPLQVSEHEPATATTTTGASTA